MSQRHPTVYRSDRANFLVGLAQGFDRAGRPLTLSDLAAFAVQGGPLASITIGELAVAQGGETLPSFAVVAGHLTGAAAQLVRLAAQRQTEQLGLKIDPDKASERT